MFDAILEQAMQLCNASAGGLRSYDGECFGIVASRGLPPAFVEARRTPQRAGPQTALGRIARGEPVAHIPDIRAEEVYHQGDPLRRAAVELAGARTLLAIPLLKDGVLIGAFTVYRQEVQPFSERGSVLLQKFRRAIGDRDGRCRSDHRNCASAPATFGTAGATKPPPPKSCG